MPRSAKAAPPRKRAYHHGDLRRSLLDAALAIVAEGGLPALSLREAARRAGVSPAAPYHHFSDRDAMVAELVVEGFTGMRASMERELAIASEDRVDRFMASGRGYVNYAMAHPASFQIMFGAGRVCDISRFPAIVEASTPVAAILFEGVGGLFPLPGLDHLDVPRLGLFAWSLVHGISGLVLDGAVKPAMSSGVGQVDALGMVATFGEIIRALHQVELASASAGAKSTPGAPAPTTTKAGKPRKAPRRPA